MNLYGAFSLIYLIVCSPGAEIPPSPVVPPSRHVIEGVPYIRQIHEHCGPAAMAMVLEYYNVVLSQQELAKEFYRKEISGSLNLDLLISARRHGFDAEVPEGSRDLIKKYISRDIPIIAMVRSAPGKYHFMVIFGYDDTREFFQIHSGNTRDGTIDYRELERCWEPTGRWMLVVMRKEWGPEK